MTEADELLESLDRQLRSGVAGTIDRRADDRWELTLETDESPTRLRITFNDCAETRHLGDRFTGGGLFGQHPLLWNDFEPIAALYLYESVEDPITLLDEIRATVNEWSGGWRNADEYLDREHWPEDITEPRPGPLLEGPLSLIRQCEKVVRRLGIEHASTPGDASKSVPRQVLICGSSFVIARGFEAESL